VNVVQRMALSQNANNQQLTSNNEQPTTQSGFQKPDNLSPRTKQKQQ
jgi:hypothetical protein